MFEMGDCCLGRKGKRVEMRGSRLQDNGGEIEMYKANIETSQRSN